VTRRISSLVGGYVGRYWIDAAVVVLAVIAVIEDLVSPTATLSDVRYDRGPELVIIPLLLFVSALMLLRRRLGLAAPIIALVLLGVSSFPARAWIPSSVAAYLLVIVVAATLGYHVTFRTAAPALALVVLMPSIAVLRQPDGEWSTWLWVVTTLTLAWFAGFLVRRPIERARDAEERARRLEQEQAFASERAIAGERQRIARELHDVIAHSVSVMTVQAGAVRRFLLPEQERERQALLAVEETGRQALTEMRRLVGLLREQGAMPEFAPQPSMKTIDTLIGSIREAGLPVELHVEGEPRELAPGVDLSAYRVVQEALTNALKYAGPARAWVSVRWRDETLDLEIANDGATEPSENGSGHGLAGMRERVGLYGGSVESGPREGGGFVVRAHLPTGEPA
jgi:signal transduction histidine kinase